MRRHPRPFDLSEIKIEVTYKCDLNCIHCSSDARPSNLLEMTLNDCLRILDDAARMGIRNVDFSGGEPFLWPHINDVADAAVKHNMNVTVYTSGNIREFKQQATRLHDLGVTKMIFSIFGANDITHERITRRLGSLDRTKVAMVDALSVGLITELHFVPMNNNYRELIGVIQLASQLGASRVSVLRLVPQGRAALISDHVLSRIENLELRRQIQALRKEHGDDFIRTGSPYNFLLLNDRPTCYAALDRLTIGPDLRIYPCDAFKRIGASELVKTEEWSCLAGYSLPECWQKSPYLEAVRTYLTTDFKAPCDSCILLKKCLSGCLAQKVITYGSLEKKPDPACLASNLKGETV
jgi:radical SAM protein with 4Fe4S-binding SPASM domain